VRAHAVRAIRLEVESANPEPSRSRREMRGMEDLFHMRLALRSENLLAARPASTENSHCMQSISAEVLFCMGSNLCGALNNAL
jgi:hypothetical protein